MLRQTLAAASILAALTITAGGVHAQRGSAITIDRGQFAVVPYGGYLVSQNFIEGPLNSNLGAVSAPLFGVQASLPLAPVASLIGSVGYASGDLEVGVPFLGGIGIGGSNALVLDAGVEFRAPGMGRFVPILHLGGGAIRRELTVAGISASATDFQVSGGLGADIPLGSNLALRLMAKDHYGKSDFGSVGGLSASTRDIHNFALTGGLSISF